MDMIQKALAWLMARFGEWSTLQGAIVVVGALVLFGILPGAMFKLAASVGLAGLGGYLVFMARN